MVTIEKVKSLDLKPRSAMKCGIFIVVFSCLVSLIWTAFESEGRNVASLIPQLEDPDVSVRRHTAQMLGGMMGEAAKDAVPALVKALGDEDEQVRLNALMALGVIGDPGAVPVLREA